MTNSINFQAKGKPVMEHVTHGYGDDNKKKKKPRTLNCCKICASFPQILNRLNQNANQEI